MLSRWAFVAIVLASTATRISANEYDGGGRLGDYLNLIAAKADDPRVEITGVCASACTVKLGARNACVHAGASLLFHAARDADGRFDRLASLMMLQEYPRRVQAWAKRRRALDSSAFTAMTAAEAIALGVPDCDAPHRR